MRARFASCLAIFSLLFSVCFLSLPAIAQPDPDDQNNPPREGAPSSGPRRPGYPRFREMLLQRIKAKDPENYERLKRLQEEDPEAFRQEIFKYLKKSGKHRRGKWDGASWKGERDEAEQHGRKMGSIRVEISGNRPEGKPPFRHGKGFFLDRFLSAIKQKHPEQYNEICELMKQDPQAARKKIHELFSRFRKDYFHPDPRIAELVKEYKQTQDEEARKRIRGELLDRIRKGFEERMRMRREQLEKMRQKLDKIEEQINKQVEQKEAICQKLVEMMLEGGKKPFPPPNFSRPPGAPPHLQEERDAGHGAPE